jgi:catechol 2,3-dioxygenase-like lactoylglutathione lyase family enzyme
MHSQAIDIPTSSMARKLLRAAAAMGIVGGGLRILVAFLPYVPQSIILETIYAVVDLGFLFGLAAVYWPISERLGWAGAAGYTVATAGAASLVGPDPNVFGLEFYMVGSATLEFGLLGLAVMLIRRRVHRPAALLWMTSLTAASVAVGTGGNAPAFAIAGSALGLGFVWAGLSTYSRAGEGKGATRSILPLNEITIDCNDLAESSAFYQTLGFRLTLDDPTGDTARLAAPDGTALSLHRRQPVSTGAVLYFENPTLDEWVARLTDDGVTFEQTPTDQSWGWREARLRDPSGNPICLFSTGANRRFPPWRVTGRSA